MNSKSSDTPLQATAPSPAKAGHSTDSSLVEENPWKILSADTRYENPWIKVVHHEVTDIAGNPGIYGTVHFKNTAIGIIPLDRELNTWLVGQYRFPLQDYSWEIPEGGGEATATTLDSAKRELREETGITAASWEKILDMHLSNSVSDEKAVIYLAQDLEFGEAEPEDCEELVIRKVPFTEALRMALDGEITDSITVAGLLAAARIIGK